MMLINSGATHANGGAAECGVEDWMAYDKAVRDAGIPRLRGSHAASGTWIWAEEVASEAVEAALVHWPVQGVPARPGAGC